MTNIFIRGVKLTIKQHAIASDTIEYLTCKVHFETEEWAECTDLKAYIGGEDTVYEVPIVDGEITAENQIVVTEGMWTIYVQGITPQGVKISTNADVLWVTASGGVKGKPYVRVPFDMTYQSYLTAKHAEYVAEKLRADVESGEIGGGGGSLTGEKGYKVIGFTEGCDYVATAEDGYTAFAQALNEASDGDTILVMGGEYKGEATLNIDKDITFIAIGDAVINFDVKTQGGGDFSYENWEWTTVYEGKHTKWNGFTFNKYFDVGVNADPDGGYHNGFTTATNCIFNGEHCVMVGNFTNCAFSITQLTVGHYYGADSSTFTDCKFNCSIEASAGSDNFKRCDFHFNGNNSVNFTTWKEDTFINCKMYAPNATLTIQDSHSGEAINLNDTVIFAVSVVNGSWGSINGGFLFTPTAIN